MLSTLHPKLPFLSFGTQSAPLSDFFLSQYFTWKQISTFNYFTSCCLLCHQAEMITYHWFSLWSWPSTMFVWEKVSLWTMKLYQHQSFFSEFQIYLSWFETSGWTGGVVSFLRFVFVHKQSKMTWICTASTHNMFAFGEVTPCQQRKVGRSVEVGFTLAHAVWLMVLYQAPPRYELRRLWSLSLWVVTTSGTSQSAILPHSDSYCRVTCPLVDSTRRYGPHAPLEPFPHDQKNKKKNLSSASDGSFEIQAKHTRVIYCYVNTVGMESANTDCCGHLENSLTHVFMKIIC